MKETSPMQLTKTIGERKLKHALTQLIQKATGIASITSEQSDSDKVNVDGVVSIGKKQMLDYEATQLGFYAALSNKVITMMANKKCFHIGDAYTFDTESIFSLNGFNGIMQRKSFIFWVELSPVPSSMIEEKGDMRTMKGKSILDANYRQSNLPESSPTQMVIMDGCAILWVIGWA